MMQTHNTQPQLLSSAIGTQHRGTIDATRAQLLAKFGEPVSGSANGLELWVIHDGTGTLVILSIGADEYHVASCAAVASDAVERLQKLIRPETVDYRHNEPREYIPAKDVARFVKAAIRHDFPGVKFSVVSSRGSGSSVDISWTDGPPSKAVDGVGETFAGGRFDGMIDLAYSVRHVLYEDSDGITRAMCVASDGTEGSRGSDPAYYVHPEDLPKGARPVSLSAKYVCTRRDISPHAFKAALLEVLRRHFDFDADELAAITFDRWGRMNNAPKDPEDTYHRNANELARQLLEEIDLSGCKTFDDVVDLLADRNRQERDELEAREIAWQMERARSLGYELQMN